MELCIDWTTFGISLDQHSGATLWSQINDKLKERWWCITLFIIAIYNLLEKYLDLDREIKELYAN